MSTRIDARLSFAALSLIAVAAALPMTAWGETDRITVEDPATNVVKFRVTSDGNVSGSSFTGAPVDGAAIAIQQGPTEAAGAVKLSVKDNTGASKFVVQSNGATGIGATPDRPLVVDSASNPLAAGEATILVQGSANKERFELRSMGWDPAFQAKRSFNNSGTPGATLVDSALFRLGGSGHDGTNYVIGNRAMIAMFSANTWTPSSQGTYFTFETTQVGSTSRAERLRVTDGGNIGIGTTTPAYKLDVVGDINVTGNFKINGTNLSTGGGSWGSISGSLTNQADLQSALNNRQLHSAALDAVSGTNTGDETQTTIFTKIATRTDGTAVNVQQGPTEGSSAVKLSVKDNTGTRKFLVQSNGSTGIGATPDRPLVVDSGSNPLAAGEATILVQGSANKERFELRSMGWDPAFQAKNASNNGGVPGATAANAAIFRLGGSGHDGTAYVGNNKAMIAMFAANAWTTLSQGTYLTFETTPIGATSRVERVRVADSGNVGIGTTNPTQKLEVAGGIRINPSAVSLPTPDATYEGTLYYVNAVGSTPGHLYICMNTGTQSTPAYTWNQIK